MAHVMDYQEILEAAKESRTIWVENKRLDRCIAMTFDGVDFVNTQVGSFLMLMQPSEELMEATPWKDNPFEE